MRCNARIQLDKDGQQETYCQRKQGHDGEHSIKSSDDPFTPAPKGVQLVLSVRPAPAETEPGDLRGMPGAVPPVRE
jgi:hypothetical protein